MKGQMVHCPESDSILFVSSPFLNGLEGLTGRGLFISDIPLHDATRDVILVGEQARAQVSKFVDWLYVATSRASLNRKIFSRLYFVSLLLPIVIVSSKQNSIATIAHSIQCKFN